MAGEEHALHFPKIFPTMTSSDTVVILQWHVKPGDIVQAGDDLLTVRTPIADIDIQATEEIVEVPHCLIARTEEKIIQMDQFLMTLAPVRIHPGDAQTNSYSLLSA